MRTLDVLNLLEQNELIVIITPNVHEAKLLRDRFITNSSINLKQIDSYTLQYNESKLIITHPRVNTSECPLNKATYVIVEFPDACPKNLFRKLPAINVEFCGEIV